MSENPDANASFHDSPFTSEEFDLLISATKCNTTLGLDQVDYRIIRNLPQSARVILLNSLNYFFSVGVLYPSWTRILVALITSGSSKFRPMFLASSAYWKFWKEWSTLDLFPFTSQVALSRLHNMASVGPDYTLAFLIVNVQQGFCSSLQTYCSA